MASSNIIRNLSRKNLYSDSNANIYKLGLFSETAVKYMLAYDGINEPSYDKTHANRLMLLKKNGLLLKDIDSILYALRKTRNDASYNVFESVEEVQALLQFIYKFGVWFMQTYGEWEFEPKEFILPENKEMRSSRGTVLLLPLSFYGILLKYLVKPEKYTKNSDTKVYGGVLWVVIYTLLSEGSVGIVS